MAKDKITWDLTRVLPLSQVLNLLATMKLPTSTLIIQDKPMLAALINRLDRIHNLPVLLDLKVLVILRPLKAILVRLKLQFLLVRIKCLPSLLYLRVPLLLRT